MNLLEKFFLWGCLLAVGAVGLVVLTAVGVDIPFLSHHSSPTAVTGDVETGGYGLPPPEFPDEEEEPSLLAELAGPNGDPWPTARSGSPGEAGLGASGTTPGPDAPIS